MTSRADQVAAIATGIGVGLLAFMLVWSLGVHLAEQLWVLPVSAVVAMATALVVGVVVAAVVGRRLARGLTA